jgi:RNA polymerase sigma-70 factor (ECF subfamily)
MPQREGYCASEVLDARENSGGGLMLVHPENERDLLDQARIGNQQAFETLVKHYDRKISRLAFRITGNRDDAQEALQEAFLKAYVNLQSFHGNSRFYTWLARIAVNEALTRLRRQITHRQVSLEDSSPQRLADWCENPEQRYARSEREQIVNEALQGLDPSLRCVLMLRYLEELSNEEIARHLGLSVPAVKSRLMRGRIRLRQHLDQHFGKRMQRAVCRNQIIPFPKHAKAALRPLESKRQAAARRPQQDEVLRFAQAA